MEESTISMAMFHTYVKLPEGNKFFFHDMYLIFLDYTTYYRMYLCIVYHILSGVQLGYGYNML